MQPQAADKMPAVWPHLYCSLLQKVRSVRVKDKHVLDMLVCVEDDVENPKSQG